MDVFAVSSLLFEVLGDIEIGLLGWLHGIGYNFKCECSKLFQIDTLMVAITM
jgi:hypothetical protein